MNIKIPTLTLLLLLIFTQAKPQINIANDSIISQSLSLISKDSIEMQLQWLQDMGTRFMMASNHKQVAEAIKARFESYGITEVRLDSFLCNTDITYGILQYDTTTWQYNVEAKIIGSLYPDEEIILMGHYDNVQLDSNPEIFSAGADDDGSGTVAALETARVLMEMGYQPEKTIVFLTTAAEELMYFGDAGSEHYAAEAAAAGRNIWGVINNDMIGYDNGSDMIGFSNVIGSEEITGIAALIAETYTELATSIPPPQNNSGADLKPFIDAGYSGLYLEEYIFNPYYHTEQDIVENCDLDYLTEAIKISCGTVIYSDISLNTAELAPENLTVSVYPNPCNDYLRINIQGKYDVLEGVICNISGQEIASFGPVEQTSGFTLSMSEYPPGMYFLRIIRGDRIMTEKVIKF